ncbi:unnamed protein product [Polarella glacialis]|uniref:Uncharacterized protein n=1 Tax=Polarella glacialis TaxID=89957 RepID=A0A813LHN6_POLGL|nr:unnamed protein product [Polarella glacialis]
MTTCKLEDHITHHARSICDRRAMQNKGRVQAFMREVHDRRREFELGWKVDNHRHCAAYQELLAELAAKHFPKPTTHPSKTYITDQTWDMIVYKRTIRNAVHKQTRHIKRPWLSAAFDAWKGTASMFCVGDESLAGFTSSFVQIRHLSLTLKILHGKVQSMLSHDRKEHLEKIASTLEYTCCHKSLTDVLKSLSPCRGEGAKQKTQRVRPLPKLQLEDGSFAGSMKEVSERWQQHFAKIEVGEVVDLNALRAVCVEEYNQLVTTLPPPVFVNLPTLTEVEHAIRKVRKGRAVGEDMLPSELFQCNPSVMARLVYPLALKAVALVQPPHQLQGGLLHRLYKGKGVRHDCGNSRAILIQDAMAKFIRTPVRSRLYEVYEQSASPAGRKKETGL